MQQAGTAELGPYIISYRGWKIRVYRALFNAVKQHWTAERFIRVTDEESVPSFVPINQMSVDPQTGMPAMVNNLSALDVDIILDEGTDQVNMMGDAYDTLTVLASKGAAVPPQVLIELSPLESAVKKRILEMMQQPNPQAEMANAAGQAKIEQTQADTGLKQAQTMKTMVEAQLAPQQVGADMTNGMGQPQPYELPPHLQEAKAISEIDAIQAKAAQSRAMAGKTELESILAPQQMTMDFMNAQADRKAMQQKASQPVKAA